MRAAAARARDADRRSARSRPARRRALPQSLELSVSERETIAHIESPSARTDESQPGSTLHHAQMARKLKSLITMQAQEAGLLREELDRLRKRTFPTFTHYEQVRKRPVD